MALTLPLAITGLGHVGAAGAGVEAVRAALRQGRVPLREVERSPGYHRPQGARLAALLDPGTLSGWLEPAQARRMAPPARYAMAATRQALEAAGLADRAVHGRTAVVLGTCYGPSSVTEQLLRQILKFGPEQTSPACFAESVGSAPASQVAIAWRMLGPTLAIQQREASDLLALGEAMRLLRTGAADSALVLVVEEMIPLLHAVLDRFQALARKTQKGEEQALPFDRRRTGFLAAEGATALLVEPLDQALARGAQVLAIPRVCVAAFDPSAPPWDWGTDSQSLAATLRRGLARAGIPINSLEAVISGASGTLRGDRLEANLLWDLLGRAQVPALAAPKGIFGEYGGGFLAAAIVLLEDGVVLQQPSGFEPDPELRVSLTAAWESPKRVLVSSLASGGAAAWVVLDRGPGGSG